MSTRSDLRVEPGRPGPIPSTLSAHLCIDFVNSEFAEHRNGVITYDRLAMPEWRRWFLARCGLPGTTRIDAGLRSEAVRLRTLLRDLLSRRRPPCESELAALNRQLRKAVLDRRVARRDRTIEFTSAWRPSGWPAALAALVLSYVELVSRGRMDRVRVCANPSCTYMFVDDSRNGRRRWCDPGVCGNLMHVRFFRLRRGAR